MNGPAHYKEAERLLATAPDHPGWLRNIETAQVHATLALAAATIDAAYGEMAMSSDDAWRDAGAVSSTPPSRGAVSDAR